MGTFWPAHKNLSQWNFKRELPSLTYLTASEIQLSFVRPFSEKQFLPVCVALAKRNPRLVYNIWSSSLMKDITVGRTWFIYTVVHLLYMIYTIQWSAIWCTVYFQHGHQTTAEKFRCFLLNSFWKLLIFVIDCYHCQFSGTVKIQYVFIS